MTANDIAKELVFGAHLAGYGVAAKGVQLAYCYWQKLREKSDANTVAREQIVANGKIEFDKVEVERERVHIARIDKLEKRVDLLEKLLKEETENRKMAEVGQEVAHQRADDAVRDRDHIKAQHAALVVEYAELKRELEAEKAIVGEQSDRLEELQSRLDQVRQDMSEMQAWIDECVDTGDHLEDFSS